MVHIKGAGGAGNGLWLPLNGKKKRRINNKWMKRYCDGQWPPLVSIKNKNNDHY